MNGLTYERAAELFTYDPLTGLVVWRASGREAKTPKDGYKCVEVAERCYRVHRIAWLLMTGDWPKHSVDHINGNRSDNRWSNLRDVTHSVNLQNQHRARNGSKSGLLGVFRNKKKWSSHIKAGDKVLHLGTFATPEEAHAKYLEAKALYHPGAYLNQPVS